MAKSSLDVIVPAVERRDLSQHSYICSRDIIIKISSPVYVNFDDVHAQLLSNTVSINSLMYKCHSATLPFFALEPQLL